MDYETRCAREFSRKLVREAIGDYYDAVVGVRHVTVEAAWKRVLRLFADRHAALGCDEVTRGSFKPLRARDDARWAWRTDMQERGVIRRAGVKS